MMTFNRAFLFFAAIAGFATVGCNDDALSGPGYVCDVSNPVKSVTIDPSATVLLVHSPARSTDVAQVTAKAFGRLGQSRTDVPIKFASSDTTIATVDSLGVVHAIKPGSVKITASTCGESASTQITVSLITASVVIKADTTAAVSGDSIVVHAHAVAQDNSTIPGAKFVFSASPSAGVTITQKNDTTAVVRTSASGQFTITATGEGASASTTIAVSPKIFVASSVVGQLGMDVGKDFGCGLISLGRLHCWGANSFGQLGAKTDSVCFEEGVSQQGTSPCSLNPLRAGSKISFTTVSAGDGAACGILAGGALYCWGDGTDGKLGNGHIASVSDPSPVTSALNFSTVSVGGNHACGLATGGAAYCWGSDSLGQLGDARNVNSTTPIPVSGGAGFTAVLASISAGYRHTCGLLPDGTAVCWGSRSNGQLGDGTEADDGVTTPVGVAGGIRFTAISAGGDSILKLPGETQLHLETHTCAIAVGGAAFCWGSNAFGELGNGTVGGIGSFSPVPVAVSGGLSFSQISAGGTHTCGLTTTGAIYCWGRNKDLQLGRGGAGSASDSGTPQQVTGGELPASVSFLSVSAGSRHTCGLGNDGNIYCWGSNVFGALGNTLQAAFRGLPQRVALPK